MRPLRRLAGCLAPADRPIERIVGSRSPHRTPSPSKCRERAFHGESRTIIAGPASPSQLGLGGLIHRCAEETERFFQREANDPSYCYELFRRAALEGDQRAWSFLYRQYRPLVRGWIRRHSGFSGTGEEMDYFLNRAFERLWSALESAKFERFSNLSSILRYLQMCVHSAIMDHLRRKEHDHVPLEEHDASLASQSASIERQAIRRVTRDELWALLDSKMRDEKERVCIYASFALGLKPRQVLEHFDGVFASVDEVYGVKQNVIARLRRDPDIAERMLGDD